MREFVNMNDNDFFEFLKSVTDEEFNQQLDTIKQRFYKSKILGFIKIPFIQDKFLEKILDVDDLLQIDEQSFTTIFLRISDNLKMSLLNESLIAWRILFSTKNKLGRNLFDLLGEQDIKYQLTILKNDYILENLNESQFLKILDEVDSRVIEELLTYLESKNLNFKNNQLLNELSFFRKDSSVLNRETLKEAIKKTLKVKNDILIDQFLLLVSQKQRNLFSILTIKDDNQLLLYNNFNIIVKHPDTLFDTKFNPIVSEKAQIILKDIDDNVSKICLVNSKHIIGLIETIKLKEPNLADNDLILKTSLLIYSVLGYDGAKKVINDFFTFQTAEGLDRAAKLIYNKERKQFRLEHQNLFYSHMLVETVLNSMEFNRKDELYDLFGYRGIEYANGIYRKYNNNISLMTTRDEKKMYLNNALKEDIKKREEFLKNQFVEQFKKEHKVKRKKITCKEIYGCFNGLDFSQVEFDEHGKVRPNLELLNFLLGNQKRKNDCLFRLFLNNQLPFSKEILIDIINQFPLIEKIVGKNNQRFSLNSLSDVMDIYRSMQYELLPNEFDLSLETLSKIVQSKEHCNLKSNEIVLEVKKLHQLQKRRYYANIPLVNGISKKGIKYKVMDFDSDRVFAIGNKVNCFKVGAIGEPFLKYCLLNSKAVIIELYGHHSYHFAEVLRNGNGIFINGIDPGLDDKKEERDILDALIECVQEICDESVDQEKIEFATITNLHNFGNIDSLNLPKYKMLDHPALDARFYSDYTKDEFNNYVIFSSEKSVEFNSYEPKYCYEQQRNDVFNYHNGDANTDKEDIENMINSILYTSIDVDDIENKNPLKQSFDETMRLYLKDFEYVVGNKDWFYGKHREKGIIMKILPFDPRANLEWQNNVLNKYGGKIR